MTLTMSTVTCHLDSPLGRLRAVATDGALVGLYFPGHLRQPEPATVHEPAPDPDSPVLRALRRQLDEYFSRRRRAFELPLDPQGNIFQRRVWSVLQTIPYGSTRSYGDIAAEIGDPGAAQAVGAANARNPISIIIPCHRVIGADGSLTGYAGGLECKRVLLDLEGVGDDRLF
jgi:methylated-DNA-[protein]-cysteine S-methyltransferase